MIKVYRRGTTNGNPSTVIDVYNEEGLLISEHHHARDGTVLERQCQEEDDIFLEQDLRDFAMEELV